MKRLIQCVLSTVLTASLILSGGICATAATDLGLTWPQTWTGGTAPSWAANASAEVRTATLKAINDEYNAQLAAGYNLGEVESLSAYCDVINVQFKNGDNVGNPWGHEGRKWAVIVAPYAGMAFSVKSYFAVKFYPVTNVLNNEFEWTNPETGTKKIYQMSANSIMVREVNGTTVTNEGRAPGVGGIDTAIKPVMQYAIAKRSSEGYNIGFGAGNAGIYNGYTYQEFFGPDSTGASAQSDRGLDKEYGISYVVAKGNTAYIVTDKIFTAWATTWGGLDTNKPDRFSVSGVPTSDAYVDTNGNVCQDFENLRIVIDTDGKTRFEDIGTKIISIGGSSVSNFLINGSDITLLVSGSSLNAVKLNFTISKGATASIQSGTSVDLSSPVTVEVANQAGQKTTYTITGYTESSLTTSQKAAAAATQKLIDDLPSYIYTNDKAAATTAVNSYDSLDIIGKVQIKNSNKIVSAKERLSVLGSGQVRITCVGDSITEGIGATSGEYSYPSQLQKKLGNGYVVTNAGISGSFASEESCWLPYISTAGYAKGLTSNPDLVFMMHGTNDANNSTWIQAGVDFPALFEKGYRNLIDQYQALPSRPKIVLCLPMTCYNTDDGRQTNNINGTIPIIKKLAEEYGLDILDMHAFTANHSDWFPDTLHPNDTGYKFVADKFAETVNEIMNDNAVTVTDIKVGGTSVGNFNTDTKEYTIKVDSYNFPKISVITPNDCKVTVTKATKETPVSYLYVEAPVGHSGVTYAIHYDTSDVIDVVRGDVDGDSRVDVSDVVRLRAVIMKGSSTETQLNAGDMDGNKALDVSDVVSLRSYIMKGAVA